MTSEKNKRVKGGSWWIESGTEQCVFCFRWYHYEAGCYCSECDNSVCPVCAVSDRIDDGILCPECSEQERRY